MEIEKEKLQDNKNAKMSQGIKLVEGTKWGIKVKTDIQLIRNMAYKNEILKENQEKEEKDKKYVEEKGNKSSKRYKIIQKHGV